jgi:hypothetical protein
MSSAGLLVMLLSVGTVTLLFGWCVFKVLTTPNETEKVQAVTLHTPDMDDPE